MLRILILTLTSQLLVNDCSAQSSCMTIKCNAETECNNCPTRLDCQPSCNNPRGISNCEQFACVAACVCKSGYVRSANGTCILRDRCPRNNNTPSFLEWLRQLLRNIFGSGNSSGGSTTGGSSPLVCGSNERVYDCGYCLNTCVNPDMMCTAVCTQPECGCVPGFVRDTANGGVCVNLTSPACVQQRAT